MQNLVIVESPAKAKTIEKFLGKDYKVLSSYGHIRDLAKKASRSKRTATDAGTLHRTMKYPTTRSTGCAS